ncbi:hypothetical protein ACJDU8_21215 [Clostridium sp. WILCCON 0269]|uniref:Uncharacterized protein n=1 Tax=Candidatus Clostridium eludens TaxID=3381663 RepID=A0ABW8SQW8_9CLOT
MIKRKLRYKVKNCIECPFSRSVNRRKIDEDIYCEIIKEIVAQEVTYHNQYERTTYLPKCPLIQSDVIVKFCKQ